MENLLISVSTGLFMAVKLSDTCMANCCGRASVHVPYIVLYCAFYVILCVRTSAG